MQEMKQNSFQSFETIAEKLIKKHQIPGTGIGLNLNGKPFYDKGFGFRNVEEELPVTADTVFGIASMTKSFTCVGIMQLQETGKLSVHDHISKYLPEFRTPESDKTEQMTIHHFMTHTAGLPPLPTDMHTVKRSIEKDPIAAKDFLNVEIKDVTGGAIDTYEQMMDYIGGLDFKLLGAPGLPFSYSNDAYALLGTIISRVSGKTYEKYIEDHILKPCGMEHSTFYLEELSDHDQITTLYSSRITENEKQVYPSPLWWDSPAMSPAGDLKSTVNDILKYLEIFRNNGVVGTERILSADSVQQMIYPHVEIEPGKYYGYGLMITPNYNGCTLIEHGGSWKGVSSLMCVVPEKNLSGVVLTNLASVPAGILLMGAVNTYLGQKFDFSPMIFSDYEMALEDMLLCEGLYLSGEGVELEFKIQDEKLNLVESDQFHPLRCVGENLFIYEHNDKKEVVRFIADREGNIDRVSFHYRQIFKK